MYKLLIHLLDTQRPDTDPVITSARLRFQWHLQRQRRGKHDYNYYSNTRINMWLQDTCCDTETFAIKKRRNLMREGTNT